MWPIEPMLGLDHLLPLRVRLAQVETGEQGVRSTRRVNGPHQIRAEEGKLPLGISRLQIEDNMTRKPEIEKDVKSQIDNLLDLSAKKFKDDNLAESVQLGLQAWELIPEPKEAWDYYPQSLSAGFVQDYVDLGDKDNALKWIDIMAKMYDDPITRIILS